MWCGAQGVGGRVSGEPGAATANTVGTHTPGTKVHQPPRVCVWRGGVAWLCVCECVAKGVGTWTRRRQGLGLGGEAWWVGGEGLKAQALVAPKQAWRGNQHHHQPCPPSHHTTHTAHTAEKRGTSHKAQWWCVVGEALTCLSIHLTTTRRRRGRGKDRGVGSRDRKKGGGTKTSGCWWWWRDGHWWHHTHELTEKTEALCPSTNTNTHTQTDRKRTGTRKKTGQDKGQGVGGGCGCV